MKRLILVLVFLLLSFGVSAQNNIKAESLSFSSGNGPLSAGLLFEANFKRGNDIINITLGERDLYASYLKSTWKDKLQIGPCLEYYHNVPAISGMMIFSPLKNLSTFGWVGYSAGAPDMKVELTNWKFLFFYQSLDLNYKRFGTSGAIMYFENNWLPMLDFKYRQPIMENVNFFTSAGYNFFGEGSALLRIGITYKITK